MLTMKRYLYFFKPKLKAIFLLFSLATFLAILITELNIINSSLNRLQNMWISNETMNETQIGCMFPNADPFDPTILEFVEHPSAVTCPKVQPYLTYVDMMGYLRINETEIDDLKLNSNYSEIKCQYRMFDRPNDTNDKTWKYASFEFLVKAVRLNMDMVKVNCSARNLSGDYISDLYINIHAHPAKKPKTFAKPTENKLSVLLIAIDSVSYSALKRNMPLTYDYITKSMGMIMLERLNKVADNSLPNMMAVLTGKRILTDQPNMKTELNFSWPFNDYYDDYPLIWKNFSSKGYSIAFNEDKPDWGLFHYTTNGFKKKPVDYYYHTFWRALEYEFYNHDYEPHCFANTPKGDILLDITKRHLVTMTDTLQFIYSFFVEYSHDEENEVEMADELYAGFWKEMFQGGYLNKTAIIFMSDHGQRYGELRKTLVGMLESRNPFLGIWFPEWFYKLHPHIKTNLLQNTQRLTSTFDVHETLKDVLNANYDGTQRSADQRSLSLLYELPTNRTCFQAGVPDHHCLCLTDLSINISLPFLEKAANAIVNHLNSLISDYANLCQLIKVIRIIRAENIWSSDQLKTYQSAKAYYKMKFSQNQDIFEKIRLTIETEPNLAVFEAILNKNKLKLFNVWQVHGDVERLSSYGNTSYCMDNATFRKFCTCKS